MKPRAEGGVVDHKMNVYGTENLKIADLSICPDNLGTNTYSSALLCGEKCAQLIADELGELFFSLLGELELNLLSLRRPPDPGPSRPRGAPYLNEHNAAAPLVSCIPPFLVPLSLQYPLQFCS